MSKQEQSKKANRKIAFKGRYIFITILILVVIALFFLRSPAADEQTPLTAKESKESFTNAPQQEIISENKLPALSASEVAKKLGITIDQRPSLGSENAPITIIAFIDPLYFRNKYVYNVILPELMEKYVDNEKVRVIFKHYIQANRHQNVIDNVRYGVTMEELEHSGNYEEYLQLLTIANCANEIAIERYLLAIININEDPDKYFISGKDTGAHDDMIIKFYSPLELEYKEFDRLRKCSIYSYDDQVSKIKEDFEESKNMRITETTFFINTKKIKGIQTFETLDKILKQQLGEQTETKGCFSSRDCPKENPYCLYDGSCSSVECAIDDDCNYFNKVGYQTCLDRCYYDDYHDSFTGNITCEENVCKCDCEE